MEEIFCEEEVLTEILVTEETKEELESLYGAIPEEAPDKYNYENEVAE